MPDSAHIARIGALGSKGLWKFEAQPYRSRDIAAGYFILANPVVSVRHISSGVSHPELQQAIGARRSAKVCVAESSKGVKTTLGDSKSI